MATNLLTKKSRYSSEGLLEVLPRSQNPRSPQFISVTSRTVEARTGGNVSLDCAARGSPIPELTWTFLPHIPRSKLRPVTNASQNGVNVLTLHQVTPEQTGTYTCTAASAGTDKQTTPATQVSSPAALRVHVERGRECTCTPHATKINHLQFLSLKLKVT